MTSSELQFAVIKDELTAMVDDIIRQFLNDKIYEKDQAQNWCNGISDEIIKALHQQQRGFKFVCTCTIFQKGYASMNFLIRSCSINNIIFPLGIINNLIKLNFF